MTLKNPNPIDLLLSSYQYDLPLELIAQRPALESRLLVYKVSTNEVIHDTFKNIGAYLPPESLLIFNRSKVFPSRLLGTKESGGKAEIFLLSTNGDNGIFPALIKTSSKKKIGDKFFFADQQVIATLEKINQDATFGVSFNREDISDFLETYISIEK